MALEDMADTRRTAVAPAGDAARERIRDGAARAVVQSGPAVSMADIAALCGTSKALLHYHYADRAHLLADVVRRFASRIVARERAAIGAAGPGNAVDAHWQWVEAELRRGELRALLELATVRDDLVRDAVAAAAQARRASASATATLVFEQLGLIPRVPGILLGDTLVAFLDGLALDVDSDRDPRVSFDVLWLALLGLVEENRD
ncbi:MAG: regulatory protein TetR [Gemmatimonadetes bacterium]|jgi:AcrR family transcriptional regulator|nr:regulatory protein TetR [Gemmatimonadota bacterium]